MGSSWDFSTAMGVGTPQQSGTSRESSMYMDLVLVNLSMGEMYSVINDFLLPKIAPYLDALGVSPGWSHR